MQRTAARLTCRRWRNTCAIPWGAGGSSISSVLSSIKLACGEAIVCNPTALSHSQENSLEDTPGSR